MAEIKKSEFFIVGGQKAYIAEVGKEFRTEYDRRDSRLRVIFDNGTESDVLMRSLQRALHRDGAGRRITEPDAGPLFEGVPDPQGTESGTICSAACPIIPISSRIETSFISSASLERT